MLRRLRNLLVRILVLLIDGQHGPADEKELKYIRDWMEMSYAHPGYQAYFKDRNLELIGRLSNGKGMVEEPRDAYVSQFAQRVEILLLNKKMKMVYLAHAAADRKKREAEEKKTSTT